MDNKIWKIAIVGCGDIAERVYMPHIHKIKRSKVVACCDLLPERLALFASIFGIPKTYTDIDDLLTKEDFDILLDTASIQAHFELNMKALKAGKHLYSQKPIGLTVSEATEMIETAKKTGVKFAASPIHMLRPDIQEAKRLIREGILGKINLLRVISVHGGPEYFHNRSTDPSWFYEPGAGALYDMGVHALHQATGIMGAAKAISCMAAISEPTRMIRNGPFKDKLITSDKMFDNYMIHLNFGDGSIGDILTGYCVKATNASSLEIYGQYGSIIFTGDHKKPLKIYIDDPKRNIRGWLDQFPYDTPAPPEFFQCSCVEELICAIEENREPTITPEHARHVIEIMCHVEQSALDGTTHHLETTF